MTPKKMNNNPGDASASFAGPICSAADLKGALDASLNLQRHYGKLLNQWDGGKRTLFRDADEWIARLREVGTLPPNAEVSEGGTRDSRIETAAQSRPSLH
jgi:hypothetical protein